MILANEEAVMTVLEALNFVAFNPLQNNNPISVRRRNLIAKLMNKSILQQTAITHFQKKLVTD